ncbi:MAG TPA: hypothetical protein VK619_09410 [Pyrinomonadaceae bacterium]|nr:hypothetical protein [Pyrinomonadaceae bacterium]
MNNLKSYVLAAVGILCLVASFTLNAVRANSEAPTVASSTAHFNPGRTYLLNPANGGSQIKCKVTVVDGAWLACDGLNEWVNTNAIMSASDSR